MASRTATPQPWASAGQPQPQGLQLPHGAQAAKGRGAAGGGRGVSADPDGGAGGAPEPARATDVDSLMDAVGASGVDLGAEEESLRATNDRLHAQTMHAAGSNGSAPNAHAYAGIDRSRKQDFIDPGLLAECVKKVAAAFQLKTLEPDTIPLIALATRARLMSLVNASIAARDHRQQASHFRVPPLVAPPPPRKRRRRNPLDGEVDEDLGADNDHDDADVEMRVDDADEGVKVPAWDTLVYDDPERLLGVLERVDREEERKKRRERLQRDERENEERQLAEALAASEAARIELEEQQAAEARKDAADQAAEDGTGGGGGGKKKKADAKGKGKAKDASGVPGTPAGKGLDSPALTKDGKPKKERKKKAKGEDGASGTSTPAAGSKGAGGKNLSEDIKKRLTDQTALRSLGGQKFSWLNAGIGSPSPAGGGPGGLGTPGGLPKPKFAPASALPPPSFAPVGNGAAGTSTSLLNPANSSGGRGGGAGDAAATALTTSRLNIPPLHDAQRTQLAREQWAAGHRVVEAQDLLFALDRERGMGTGRGTGRSAAIRGRAGITRGAYRGGMQGR
ncbi:hypothetical protein JCM3770_006652 [Rhodotorula araucariae]